MGFSLFFSTRGLVKTSSSIAPKISCDLSLEFARHLLAPRATGFSQDVLAAKRVGNNMFILQWNTGRSAIDACPLRWIVSGAMRHSKTRYRIWSSTTGGYLKKGKFTYVKLRQAIDSQTFTNPANRVSIFGREHFVNRLISLMGRRR
jgi:hypothetical protein